MPDLCYGRIPASTKEEMKNVADKIWKYENSNNTIEPTTRFLGAALFQDRIPKDPPKLSDGREDREYVKTVESICSTLESKFDYMDRVYCTSGNVVPNAWHEGITGFPFPNYLKNESAWQGKTQDIINSINANCNIVLHRDHGADNGWDKPSFLRSHLSQLTNTTYPIVFSINCNTGNFAVPNSFSKALLCQKQGGAAGIIGATAPSYTYRNDVIALAIMKSIWPSLDFKTYRSDYELNAEFDQPVATLGEALAVGLIKMEETFSRKDDNLTQRREFHCIGDPSMYIYWNKARDIEDNLSVTYDFDTGTAKIQLGGLQSAYISIWDQSSIYRYYGNYVEHKTYLGETMVTIIKPGMRAKAFFLGEYISQPTSLGGASIKNISFAGDTELKVELDESDCEGLSLSVTESDNITPGQTHSVDVQTSEVDYTIARPSNRLFFVSLRRGDEILDSKTIYRRN